MVIDDCLLLMFIGNSWHHGCLTKFRLVVQWQFFMIMNHIVATYTILWWLIICSRLWLTISTCGLWIFTNHCYADQDVIDIRYQSSW